MTDIEKEWGPMVKQATQFKVIDKLIGLQDIYGKAIGIADQKFQQGFQAILASANKALRDMGYQFDISQSWFSIRVHGGDGFRTDGKLFLKDSLRRDVAQVEEDLDIIDLGYGWHRESPGVLTKDIGG
jgi:hypothetical protein